MDIIPRADVLSELRGQTLEIHGLGAIFAGWPFLVNSHVEDVRNDVVDMLNK